MNSLHWSDSLGSGMGTAASYGRLLCEIGAAAWKASARLSRWAAGARTAPGPQRGAAPAPAVRAYAPSTLRRYGQIAIRYAKWAAQRERRGGPAPDCAGFLEETAGSGADAAVRRGHGRRDARHLALRRTTICALRAMAADGQGPDPTAGLRLPPRPPPMAAAAPGTIAALRDGARSERETLLLILGADLRLRPGQMDALRWCDVCLSPGYVLVPGRRGRRQIAIPPESLAVLAKCAGSHSPEDYLFPSPARGSRQPATVRTLQNALRQLVRRVGAAPDTTFTSLRKLQAQGPPPAPVPSGPPRLVARSPAARRAWTARRAVQSGKCPRLNSGTRYHRRGSPTASASWP